MIARAANGCGWVIVQRAAAAAGLDASQYSGHSLRAGLATSAAQSGKADREIMKQGRWRGRAMVDRYVRDARLLEAENAAAGHRALASQPRWLSPSLLRAP